MKKSFALLALVPFVLFSCQKEVAQNDIDTVVPTLDNGIPTVISCDINQEATNGTRTQYADNQTFGWTNGDQIRMPLKNGSDQIDFYSFTASDANNGDVSAIFYKNKTNENLEPDYDPIGNGWTNLGYLIYPTSIFNFSGSQSDGVWNSGNYPVVNLPASYDYSVSNPLDGGFVPMIGRKVGATYRFATAVGLIKVTISNVPSSLKTVKLISSNKCIAGKFAISDSDVAYDGSDVIIAHIDNDSDYNSAGTKVITLNVSSIEQGGPYSFYFPVPVGTYPENTLRVEFAGTDGEANFTNVRRIQKPLVITRNEILEIPEITCPSFRLTNSATNPRVEFNCLVKKLRYGFTTNGNIYGASYSAFNNTTYSQWDTGANLGSSMSTLSSGKYYFHYILTNDDSALGSLEADHVIGYGTIPFYYLSSSDNTTYIGNYTKSSGQFYKGVGAEDTSRGALTLSVSADCNKGNVQVGTMLGNRTDTTIPMYGNLSGSTSTFTLFKSPDDATYFFVNGSNYFYVGQSDESLEYETVFSSEINDVTFSLATGETTTLTNNAYIVLYYHAGATTGAQKRFIQGQNIVYTKNAQ